MMQSMMQNPAMMEMARSPSMQRAAEQLLGGAGAGATGGGGGLDIGSLLNAAGPILGQLMGGGVGGGVPGAGRAPGSNGQVGAGAEPEPLEVVLAKEMGEHDAAKWKECIESDRAKQAAEAGGTREKEFSEAYLAALPPRAAGGLLQSMLGEAADGE